jgi:AmiR/NasT family two-component response regulator
VATGLLLEPAEQLRDRHLDPGMARALDYRAEVARAQGMVMVDLGVGLAEALVLLRAHAFAGDVMLIDLARRVISGYRLPGPDDAGSGLE